MIDNRCGYCGTKKVLSRAGNLYCPNICWEKEEYKLDQLAHEAEIDTNHSDWGDR